MATTTKKNDQPEQTGRIGGDVAGNVAFDVPAGKDVVLEVPWLYAPLDDPEAVCVTVTPATLEAAQAPFYVTTEERGFAIRLPGDVAGGAYAYGYAVTTRR